MSETTILVQKNKLMEEIAIAWCDLTISYQSILRIKEPKTNLNAINGYISFGSLNALMGPSGSGKSTLLKCINGKNVSLMSRSTQIYLNSTQRIRSCFIVQDVKEHLLMGLTAKECLMYASILKNKNQKVDHKSNVSKLMNELLLNDITNTVIGMCSGGEQKRLAVASELTSKVKPNLLCIDEPTSGLDSNATEIIIQCLKEVSVKHSIGIVTSIHQPNNDVLMMFDSLYVLAKGGQCVYSGQPQQLHTHLSQCGIQCNQNQIPIEVLLKVGSNGTQNTRVQLMVNRMLEQKSGLRRRCEIEAKLCNNRSSNGFQANNESFRWSDTWYLLLRSLRYTYRSQWKAMLIQFVFIVGLGYLLTKLYNEEIGKPDGCFTLTTLTNNNCTLMASNREDQLREDNLLSQNLKFHFFANILIMFLQIVATTMTFTTEVKIFLNEHSNGWYSTMAYYWAKTLMEIPLTILISFSYCYVVYYESNQLNDNQNRFISYSIILFTAILCSQGLGFLIGIISESNDRLASVLSVGTYLVYVLFCGFFIPINELHETLQYFSYVSFVKQAFECILITVYGFDRCDGSGGEVSLILYQLQITGDNVYWINCAVLAFHFIYLRCLALIALLLKANRK